MLRAVRSSLDDDKAVDVTVITLSGKSTMADYLIVASGTSKRQIGAMADHLVQAAKTLGLPFVAVEGQAQCDWVLVDAGDVVIHLFRPELREFYALERLWGSPALVDGRIPRQSAIGL